MRAAGEDAGAGNRLVLARIWTLEGIGVQAQDACDHGEERRWIKALVGCPTCLWQDLGLHEPEQLAAELAPDPLADRCLLQERADLGGQGLDIHLTSRVVSDFVHPPECAPVTEVQGVRRGAPRHLGDLRRVSGRCCVGGT